MNLNTQHLLYLMEIERTRSISQAAANLYMGQPNLSRILRDTEAALRAAGFRELRLAVDKGNPQSWAFWTKNGYARYGPEKPNGFSAYLPMRKAL